MGSSTTWESVSPLLKHQQEADPPTDGRRGEEDSGEERGGEERRIVERREEERRIVEWRGEERRIVERTEEERRGEVFDLQARQAGELKGKKPLVCPHLCQKHRDTCSSSNS